MVNALQRRGNDLLTRPMAVLRKVLLDVRRPHMAKTSWVIVSFGEHERVFCPPRFGIGSN
jgi:hypothetical protein